MKNNDAWSLYWQGSHQESCIANNGLKDQDILTDVWRSFAESITPSSTVLDLATGNGSVPNSLLRFNSTVKITGVDYADIDPKRSVKNNPLLNDVIFVPNVDITILPFDDRQFDYITSQFGLEYSALDLSTHEFARVLKSKGQCLFIMHHKYSEVVTPARTKVAEFKMIEDSGLLASFGRFLNDNLNLDELNSVGEKILADTSSSRSQEVTGQLFAAIEKLIELKENGESSVNLQTYFSSMKQRFSAEYSRLEQLVSVSLSESEVESFCMTLKNLGISATFQTLNLSDDTGVLAWKITGNKL